MKFLFCFSFLSWLFFAVNSQAEVLPIDPTKAWPVRQVVSKSSTLGIAVLTPKLVWQIDCGTDTEPLVGLINSSAPGHNGTILLVDSQMSRILVVSPDGVIERIVGDLGDGPGELTGAYRVIQLTDGRIGIADGIAPPGFKFGTNGNIVFIDEKSNPAGEIHAGGDPTSLPVCLVRDLHFRGNNIMSVTLSTVVSPPAMTFVLELSLLDPFSNERKVVARNLNSTDMRDSAVRESDSFELFSGGRCDIDSSGRLAWTVGRDNWAVAVRQNGGTGSIFQRKWTPTERTETVKEEIRAFIGGGVEAQIFENEPAIKSIRWQADGLLWIEPSGVKLIAGSVACFDEISMDGELLRRIFISIPTASSSCRLDLLEGGRIILYDGFDNSALENERGVRPTVSLFQLELTSKN